MLRYMNCSLVIPLLSCKLSCQSVATEKLYSHSPLPVYFLLHSPPRISVIFQRRIGRFASSWICSKWSDWWCSRNLHVLPELLGEWAVRGEQNNQRERWGYNGCQRGRKRGWLGLGEHPFWTHHNWRRRRSCNSSKREGNKEESWCTSTACGGCGRSGRIRWRIWPFTPAIHHKEPGAVSWSRTQLQQTHSFIPAIPTRAHPGRERPATHPFPTRTSRSLPILPHFARIPCSSWYISFNFHLIQFSKSFYLLEASNTWILMRFNIRIQICRFESTRAIILRAQPGWLHKEVGVRLVRTRTRRWSRPIQSGRWLLTGIPHPCFFWWPTRIRRGDSECECIRRWDQQCFRWIHFSPW